MESQKSRDHRLQTLKWALNRLPTKAPAKPVHHEKDLLQASTILSIEQSLLQNETGYDFAFGIEKNGLKYLAPKRMSILPDLSSSKIVNEYVRGFWINKDKDEIANHFWYYLFFPPFRLGKQFNKKLGSSLIELFNRKSSTDKNATLKYINQLPASAYIMAFSPPLKRNNFSTRWVIYGMNFREMKQFIYSIFGNNSCIPSEFSKVQWKELGIILSIKDGELLPVYGLEFIFSKNMSSRKITSFLKLLNTNSQMNRYNTSSITEWISKNPTYYILQPENLSTKLWLNHIKFTIQEDTIHSIKSYFGLIFPRRNWEK